METNHHLALTEGDAYDGASGQMQDVQRLRKAFGLTDQKIDNTYQGCQCAKQVGKNRIVLERTQTACDKNSIVFGKDHPEYGIENRQDEQDVQYHYQCLLSVLHSGYLCSSIE